MVKRKYFVNTFVTEGFSGSDTKSRTVDKKIELFPNICYIVHNLRSRERRGLLCPLFDNLTGISRPLHTIRRMP